ncbi:SIS domain-containing protein [Streptomyces millisiae]|uniref:SIS domain-containing protein n=1 Tax=Streptomyces millisiae TaxID=3075542 RepID=A0ABU2LZ94_9ACTN|nr:SIS domain-containing protein [Streptomyces sp. DSM 44918]MDT0322911.1 SIS domain-containing protein [Streptomyces sp. DSM 44918]
MSVTEPTVTERETATQPDCWRRAERDARTAYAGGLADALPRPGERVAVTGCGTSWFVAQSYAALREAAGQGETDAFAASAFPVARGYDRVVAVTRSGTTTEVLDLLAALRARRPGAPVLVLTADPASPVLRAARHVVVLDYADERSVVQTRFATTALAFLRAALAAAGPLPPGVRSLAEAAVDAESALARPLDAAVVAAEQWTFLGQGWSHGLALEAALKLREAAGAWTEAYPAMEYRHGPIAVAAPGRVVWSLGELPPGLVDEVRRTGALLVPGDGLDPMAGLVRAQRLAVAVAAARGLDPDRPRHLTRSVVLPQRSA